MSYSTAINSQMQKKLRQEAKALLEQGKVDCVIGYEPGSLKHATTPLITKDKAATGRLVVNPFIINNLSNFLPYTKGRIGIVAKGCDSRSIVSLIQDNKVKREDLFILGVPCSGLIDISKVEALVGKYRDEIDDISRQGDIITAKIGAAKKEFSLSQVMFDSCLACELPTPAEYDVLLGEPTSPIGAAAESAGKLKELKAMTPAQRWAFWQNESRRCTRCYACRNVCPACYCKRCFVEETEPQWLAPMPQEPDNLMFQIIRNLHVSGRCTACGECQRACPVNIPLRALSRDMYDIVGELFEFKSGMDTKTPPLLTAYEVDEAEDLVK